MSAHINKLNNYLYLSFWVFIALLYKTFTVPFIEMGSYARVVEVVIAFASTALRNYLRSRRVYYALTETKRLARACDHDCRNLHSVPVTRVQYNGVFGGVFNSTQNLK